MILLVIGINIPLSIAVYFLDSSLLKAFLYLYSSMYFSMSIITACSYTFSILLRLNSMANALKDLSNHPVREVVVFVENNDDTNTEIISGLIEIYVEITEICKSVNICQGFPSMLGFGLIFLHSLFTYFVMFKEIFNDGYLAFVTLSAILYTLYYNFLFTAIIFLNWLKDREVSFNHLLMTLSSLLANFRFRKY